MGIKDYVKKIKEGFIVCIRYTGLRLKNTRLRISL